MSSEELAAKQREARFKLWAHCDSVVQGCIDSDDRCGYDPDDAREREMRQQMLDVVNEARSKAKAARPLAAVARRPLPVARLLTPRRSAARTPRSRSVRRVANRARGPDGPLGSDPDPPVEAVRLAAFRRDVARWLEAVKP